MKSTPRRVTVKNPGMLYAARATCLVCVALLAVIAYGLGGPEQFTVWSMLGLMSLGWGAVTMLTLGWLYEDTPPWLEVLVGRRTLADWRDNYLVATGDQSRRNVWIVVAFCAVGIALACIGPI